MTSLIELYRSHPEYLHVVTNHVPIEGLAFSALALALGIVSRSRAARVIGLFLVFVSAASVYPVYRLGDRGYDQVQDSVDDDGSAWLDEHLARANRAVYVYYALAAISVVALLVERADSKRAESQGLASQGAESRHARPGRAPLISSFVLLVSLAAIGCGVWVAYAGGKAIHREFRFDGPPPPSGKAKSHADAG